MQALDPDWLRIGTDIVGRRRRRRPHIQRGILADWRVVPEPSTWAMMLLGFAGLGFAGYRRAKKDPAPSAHKT